MSNCQISKSIILACTAILHLGCIGGTNWDISKARRQEGEACLANASVSEDDAQSSNETASSASHGDNTSPQKIDLKDASLQKATGKIGLAEKLALAQANSKNQALTLKDNPTPHTKDTTSTTQNPAALTTDASNITRPNALGVAFLAALVMSVVVGGIWLLLQPARKRSIWFRELKAKMGIGKTKSNIPIIELPSATLSTKNIAKKSRFRRKTSSTLTGLRGPSNK